MIDDEVGKYRKKSTAKGQPRSKHKHIYETVLLITSYEVPDIHTGKQIKNVDMTLLKFVLFVEELMNLIGMKNGIIR